jgi:hypothetical protein
LVANGDITSTPGRLGDIKEFCLNGVALSRHRYVVGRPEVRIIRKSWRKEGSKERVNGNSIEESMLSQRIITV